MSKPMPRTVGVSGRVVTWLTILAVTAIVVWMILFGRPKPIERFTIDPEDIYGLTAPALAPMDVNNVTDMKVTISGQTIHAVLSGDNWQLRSPINDKANNEAICDVIRLFSQIASDEVISGTITPAKYGLDKPFATATFVEGDVTKDFIIGRLGRTEIYYVKTSVNDNLYLVRGLPEELTGLRPIDLVNSQLLDFEPDEVVEIIARATTKDKGDNIERHVKLVDGRWFTLLGPSGVVFDVDMLLRDLRYVSVADVLSSSGSGLKPGTTMHLELILKNGTKKVLDIGDKLSDKRLYYIKSSDRGHTYAVTEFIAQNLSDKLNKVGTDMMGLNPDRVVGLSIATVDADTNVSEREFSKNDDGQWSIDGSVAFAVGAVMDNILEISAVSFAPDSEGFDYGFSPAVGSYEITATLSNKATIKLDVGKTTPDGKFRYVQSSSRKGVYVTPVKNAEAVISSVSKVRSDLMVFDPDTVNRIVYTAVDWSGKATTNTLVKRSGNWQANGKSCNIKYVTEVLTLLKDINASKIAPDDLEEADYGFYPAAESWRLELTMQSGQKLTFDVGRLIEGAKTGWFILADYYIRISDLSDVVMVDSYKVDDVYWALVDCF